MSAACLRCNRLTAGHHYRRRRARGVSAVTTWWPGRARRGPRGVIARSRLLLGGFGRCRHSAVGAEWVTWPWTYAGPARGRRGRGMWTSWDRRRSAVGRIGHTRAEAHRDRSQNAGDEYLSPKAFESEQAMPARGAFIRRRQKRSAAQGRSHDGALLNMACSTPLTLKNRPVGNRRHHRWHPSMRHASQKACPPASTAARRGAGQASQLHDCVVAASISDDAAVTAPPQRFSPTSRSRRLC
jgi:hypothetical protein